ncbi:hypothetical protein CEXT_311971 [Caerostris extrusa]|uniref:Uncharacterized protein n=1 Tax=Caerostris extrusa TaxID=172846 RepID=A0AAV4RJ21_CAEEX|nr:hypothetical protein CEXT_311971 [Caerostris extrusa]
MLLCTRQRAVQVATSSSLLYVPFLALLFYKDFSVNYWLNAGAAREKLIVGLATYGHSYTLRDARQTGVHALSVGPGIPGPYVKEPGVLGFNEQPSSNKLT